MTARITQAEWDALRADRKERAAVTVAENAAEAQRVKAAAQAKGASLGDEEFLARAKRIESAMNASAESVQAASGVDSYDDLTNAELSDLLKERELPHSGTKAEMVERLVEFDNSQSDEESE